VYSLNLPTVFLSVDCFAFPYFLIIDSEGHFIGYPVNSLYNSVEKLYCRGFKVAELFIQPRNLGKRATLAGQFWK
jgi:hypothetical protein